MRVETTPKISLEASQLRVSRGTSYRPARLEPGPLLRAECFRMESLRSLRRIRNAIWPDSIGDNRLVSLKYATRTRVISSLAKYIELNSELKLSLSDVAYIIGVERTYCCKVFRASTGMSFSEWNRDIRIRIARDLLANTTARISDIAISVGYSDITTFERNFRSCEGMSPRQFRKISSAPAANMDSRTQARERVRFSGQLFSRR